MVLETQLGKKGLTKEFIKTLKEQFEKKISARIKVLKSTRGEGKEAKKIVKDYADKISSELGANYRVKIIGFVIVIRKLRKIKPHSL